MKKNVQKYTGVLLVSSVLIGGIASAAITPAFPGTLPNAVSGAVIKASDINTLVTAVDNLNQRVPANLENLRVGATTGIVKSVGNNPNFESWSYSSTGAGAPGFVGFLARGTEAVPSAVQLGDNLAEFIGKGYAATKWASSLAGMFVEAAENYTDTANGTRIKFNTIPVGSVNAKTSMTIAADGDVGIGTTDPTSSLHIARNFDVDMTNESSTLKLGKTTAVNDEFLQMDNNELQATKVLTIDPATGAKTYGPTGYMINPFGGTVRIASDRDASVLDVGLDINSAFSIGPLYAPLGGTPTTPTVSYSTHFDNNEMQALKVSNDGTTTTTDPTLYLMQANGGDLSLSKTIYITNPDNVNANKRITLSGVPVYEDNTTAKAGGLTSGMVFRTAAGDLKIVY